MSKTHAQEATERLQVMKELRVWAPNNIEGYKPGDKISAMDSELFLAHLEQSREEYPFIFRRKNPWKALKAVLQYEKVLDV